MIDLIAFEEVRSASSKANEKRADKMVDIKDRWVLVTGSSRGIGRLIAEFMAAQGANLILHGRKIENLSDAYSSVKSLGVKVHAVAAELSEPEEVLAMLGEIDKLGVRVDVVFNDAGMQVAYRNEYFKTPVQDFTKSFLINTIAPAVITYHFLPKMIEAGFGRIINTTSGIRNEPEQAGYSASKAALDKFTTDICRDIQGTPVMINITDPGWCRTDLGGSHAPNDPLSSIPGMVVGAFLDDNKSGRLLPAQDYVGLTLEEAVQKALAK
ncbi:MAG: SDR family oxidoreductase [Clostridiales bacterium]|jgi:short-subunit dehydrogenase|nr:SDR family oxidoreductase [Clostridiales bacterium]